MYIDKINKKLNIESGCKVCISLPIKTIHYYENTSLLQNTHLYQQLVGLINFVAIIIKSDIAFVVSMFSEHLTNLSQCHIKLACRVMHYFDQIRFYLIFFDLKALCLIKVFCLSNDVLYANDPNTRRST